MTTAPQTRSLTASTLVTDAIVLPPAVAVTDTAQADRVARVSWHDIVDGQHRYTVHRAKQILTRQGTLEPDLRVDERHLFSYEEALAAAEQLVTSG